MYKKEAYRGKDSVEADAPDDIRAYLGAHKDPAVMGKGYLSKKSGLEYGNCEMIRDGKKLTDPMDEGDYWKQAGSE